MSKLADQLKSTLAYPRDLKYQWVIRFTDGSSLRQFLGAEEHRFPSDRLADFSQVYLVDIMGTVVATLYVDSGVLELPGYIRVAPPVEVLPNRPGLAPVASGETPVPQFRAVCFRRVKQEIEYPSMREVRTLIYYHLGWQTTLDGNNIKRTLVIDESGNYYFGDC